MLRRIIACLFVCASLPAYGSDATGFFRFGSCTYFETYRLELVRFHKQKPEKSMVFMLPGDWTLERWSKEWSATPAMECTPSGQCEAAPRSAINISRVSRRWGAIRAISGSFAIQSKDGKRIEGSFRAKFIKPATKIICE